MSQVTNKSECSDLTLEGALLHRGRETIASWVDAFLRGPGSNVPFANGLLRDPRWWFGPEEVALSRLTPKCGPGLEYHEDSAVWQERITKMAQAIKDGVKFPPLIAEYKDGVLLLSDGNHRHGALKMAGEKKYWTVIWFTSREDHDLFAKSQ